MAVFLSGAGVVPSVLPAGYTKLDYIQSTGTQYVDTGIQPSNDLATTIELTPVSSTQEPENLGEFTGG